MLNQRTGVIAVVFYGALAVVLAGIHLGLWSTALPGGAGASVDYNSEGFFVALVLALWVQFARPRLIGWVKQWPVTLLAGAVCAVAGVALYLGDWPSQVKTLNESLLAAGVAIVYLQHSRPISMGKALVCSGAIALVPIVWGTNEAVGNLAEGVGLLVLVPLAFDIVDRGILEPAASTSPAVRYFWYGLLVSTFVGVSVLMHSGQLNGWTYAAAHYVNRSHECIIGVLLVQIYFAVGLKRTGLAHQPATVEKPPRVVRPAV